MDEAKLIERLRLIEALHAGATTDGERIAAAEARSRIMKRLESLRVIDPPIEYRFTIADRWSRAVFLALSRRYGLKPFRHRGQRRTSIMLKVPKRFLDELLWPEYLEISRALQREFDELTDRVIGEAVHRDSSEATEVDGDRLLEGG